MALCRTLAEPSVPPSCGALGLLSLIPRYAGHMAAWWELAIPVGGTLVGALTGAWAQGRNSVRLLKIQNATAEQANRDRYEHERAMHLLEEKRNQYVEFAMLVEKWDMLRTNWSGPENERPEEDRRLLEPMKEKIFDLCTRLHFIASLEVLKISEEIYRAARDGDDPEQGLFDFIDAARNDLGVGPRRISLRKLRNSRDGKAR